MKFPPLNDQVWEGVGGAREVVRSRDEEEADRVEKGLRSIVGNILLQDGLHCKWDEWDVWVVIVRIAGMDRDDGEHLRGEGTV